MTSKKKQRKEMLGTQDFHSEISHAETMIKGIDFTVNTRKPIREGWLPRTIQRKMGLNGATKSSIRSGRGRIRGSYNRTTKHESPHSTSRSLYYSLENHREESAFFSHLQATKSKAHGHHCGTRKELNSIESEHHLPSSTLKKSPSPPSKVSTEASNHLNATLTKTERQRIELDTSDPSQIVHCQGQTAKASDTDLALDGTKVEIMTKGNDINDENKDSHNKIQDHSKIRNDGTCDKLKCSNLNGKTDPAKLDKYTSSSTAGIIDIEKHPCTESLKSDRHLECSSEGVFQSMLHTVLQPLVGQHKRDDEETPEISNSRFGLRGSQRRHLKDRDVERFFRTTLAVKEAADRPGCCSTDLEEVYLRAESLFKSLSGDLYERSHRFAGSDKIHDAQSSEASGAGHSAGDGRESAPENHQADHQPELIKKTSKIRKITNTLWKTLGIKQPTKKYNPSTTLSDTPKSNLHKSFEKASEGAGTSSDIIRKKLTPEAIISENRQNLTRIHMALEHEKQHLQLKTGEVAKEKVHSACGNLTSRMTLPCAIDAADASISEGISINEGSSQDGVEEATPCSVKLGNEHVLFKFEPKGVQVAEDGLQCVTENSSEPKQEETYAASPRLHSGVGSRASQQATDIEDIIRNSKKYPSLPRGKHSRVVASVLYGSKNQSKESDDILKARNAIDRDREELEDIQSHQKLNDSMFTFVAEAHQDETVIDRDQHSKRKESLGSTSPYVPIPTKQSNSEVGDTTRNSNYHYQSSVVKCEKELPSNRVFTKNIKRDCEAQITKHVAACPIEGGSPEASIPELHNKVADPRSAARSLRTRLVRATAMRCRTAQENPSTPNSDGKVSRNEISHSTRIHSSTNDVEAIRGTITGKKHKSCSPLVVCPGYFSEAEVQLSSKLPSADNGPERSQGKFEEVISKSVDVSSGQGKPVTISDTHDIHDRDEKNSKTGILKKEVVRNEKTLQGQKNINQGSPNDDICRVASNETHKVEAIYNGDRANRDLSRTSKARGDNPQQIHQTYPIKATSLALAATKKRQKKRVKPSRLVKSGDFLPEALKSFETSSTSSGGLEHLHHTYGNISMEESSYGDASYDISTACSEGFEENPEVSQNMSVSRFGISKRSHDQQNYPDYTPTRKILTTTGTVVENRSPSLARSTSSVAGATNNVFAKPTTRLIKQKRTEEESVSKVVCEKEAGTIVEKLSTSRTSPVARSTTNNVFAKPTTRLIKQNRTEEESVSKVVSEKQTGAIVEKLSTSRTSPVARSTTNNVFAKPTTRLTKQNRTEEEALSKVVSEKQTGAIVEKLSTSRTSPIARFTTNNVFAKPTTRLIKQNRTEEEALSKVVSEKQAGAIVEKLSTSRTSPIARFTTNNVFAKPATRLTKQNRTEVEAFSKVDSEKQTGAIVEKFSPSLPRPISDVVGSKMTSIVAEPTTIMTRKNRTEEEVVSKAESENLSRKGSPSPVLGSNLFHGSEVKQSTGQPDRYPQKRAKRLVSLRASNTQKRAEIAKHNRGT